MLFALCLSFVAEQADNRVVDGPDEDSKKKESSSMKF